MILDRLVGWQLKATVAAAFFGTLVLGVGTLWLTYKASEKDRGQIIASFESACSITGKPYRVDASDKPLPRKLWGKDCIAEVLRVFTERAAADRAGSAAIVTHDADQTAKAATDRPAARRSAERLIKAEQKLETAHAAVQNGQYGREWIDGLSDAFGLRDAQGVDDPAASGGHVEGSAAGRAVGVSEAPEPPAG